MGIPTYGRAYKLASPDLTDLGSPSDGPAEAGKATREKGYLAYYEICEKIGVENWAVEKPEPEAVGPYAHNGIEWVGYDDEDAVAKKVNSHHPSHSNRYFHHLIGFNRNLESICVGS